MRVDDETGNVTMATAGWYPDPDGQPTLRYWDGNNWTNHPPLPAEVPPAAMAPAPYGGAAPAVNYPPNANQPGWQQPGWQQTVQTNGLATASLILGIVGFFLCFLGVLTFAMDLMAIIFGGIGISKAGRIGGTGRGKAIAGLIIGCVAMVEYLILGIITLGFLLVV